MTDSHQKKIFEIKKNILAHSTPEGRYNAIMEMGRRLPPMAQDQKIPENIVAGCQSILYLNAKLRGGQVFFEASSDALISAGLAAVLIAAYSGETPEAILKCPPTFLTDLGIIGSLSPSRSNGLAQIHLRMKREALKFLVSV
ncbi:MAG: SufE family protein [Chlamydiota bacterium]